MKDIKVIIDTAFLPTEITHVGMKDDYINGLYQLVYGILHVQTNSLDKVSDLIVRMSRLETNKMVKKFKLQNWKKSIDEIIKKLRKLDDKSHTIVVYFPFLPCCDHIDTIITRFEMATFVIKEILENGDADMIEEDEATQDEQATNDDKTEVANDGQKSKSDEFEKNILLNHFHRKPSKSSYSIPTLSELFEVFSNNMFRKVKHYLSSQDGCFKVPDNALYEENPLRYWEDILCDEMIRRGITYAKINGERKRLHQSPFFNDSQRFYDCFFEEFDIYGQPIDNDNVQGEDAQEEAFCLPQPVKANVKQQTGVLYYMLKDIKDRGDYKNYKMVALINYLLGQSYNLKVKVRDDNNNTIKRYIADFNGKISEKENPKLMQYIRDSLIDYGFEIPKEIEDWLEKNGNTENKETRGEV